MAKLFLDTNIILDFVLDRSPNIAFSVQLLEANKDNEFYISALSIMNTVYVAKLKDNKKISKLIDQFVVIPLTASILLEANSYVNVDFEDAVQFVSAQIFCNIIITWNTKDFKFAKHGINVFSPDQYLTTSN